MKPDPKPVKVEVEKMTSAEFRKKYGSKFKKPLRRKAVKIRVNNKSVASERSKWIKEADAWFSRRVRLEASDNNGVGRCIDCGVPIEVKYADCGHFWSRSHLATRWDIDNAHLQKKQCNMGMGRPETNANYRANLITKIGTLLFDKLEARHHNIWKPTMFEIGLIVTENKARVEELLIEKGLQAWW